METENSVKCLSFLLYWASKQLSDLTSSIKILSQKIFYVPLSCFHICFWCAHTGKVTHIPASMVKDQFGMVGLLTFIRAAETDPNLVSLALGQDLTALGLNLNSPENLYPNFGGPWAETPCRPQDIDFHVPPEYLINANIRWAQWHSSQAWLSWHFNTLI